MTPVEDIKLYFFHHHHYIPIPENHGQFRASMVDYPNTQYDPEVGHALYERHLRSMTRAGSSASTASASTSTTAWRTACRPPPACWPPAT